MKLYEQFQRSDAEVANYDRQLIALAKENVICEEVQKLQGVGPVVATAIVATIGDAKAFKNGREVSVWLGLTPRQYSSGDSLVLGGIVKRGDRYMRKLLIQGARSAVVHCEKKKDKLNLGIADKKQRCGFNKASVAVANKTARIIWVIMSKGKYYYA